MCQALSAGRSVEPPTTFTLEFKSWSVTGGIGGPGLGGGRESTRSFIVSQALGSDLMPLVTAGKDKFGMKLVPWAAVAAELTARRVVLITSTPATFNQRTKEASPRVYQHSPLTHVMLRYRFKCLCSMTLLPGTATAGTADLAAGSAGTPESELPITVVEGRAFCFLPLPVLTGLPVHVNAYFELSSNRRDIWFGGDMAGRCTLPVPKPVLKPPRVQRQECGAGRQCQNPC